MSGHSKFANIKHKKEKNDAAKGKIFTKIGKEIAVAVKEGGSSDPSNNSRLRDVIAKAKSNNMPNDTIERNIKRASGDMSAANYEHITYEGYGPNGTAIIVETLTDNKNRTASNVRNAFTKGCGNVGTPGCVSFMFDKKGQIVIDKEEYEGDADELMMQVLDAAIVILGLYVFGLRPTLYAVVSIFVSTKISDAFLEGFKTSKAAFIITNRYEEVAERLMDELDRGVTGLHAQGMYTEEKKCVLYCVVSRKEIVRVKEIVNDVDSSAFVIVSDVREVLGEGFLEYSDDF